MRGSIIDYTRLVVRSEWRLRKIGDVCEVIAGQSPNGEFYNPDGNGMPFYQGKKDFGEKYLLPPTTWTTQVTKIARKGDVLLSVRAPVGPVNFANDEICIGRGLAAIRSQSELDPNFVYYQLQYLRPLIAGKDGAVFPSISKSEIEALPFWFAPPSEQRRVVEVLDEVFEGIQTAKDAIDKNLKNAHEIFESHLHEIFMQRDASHVWRRLEDVCEKITVGHVGSMAAQYRDQGIPFLRSQNIRPFQVSLEGVVYIDDIFHQSLAKSQLRPGDVAVVRTGYPGTAAVIPDSLLISNCSDLVIVRPGPLADPHYLALFFNSRLGKELVAGRLVGAAQKHFNVAAAKHVEISFPTIVEQRRQVEKVKNFSEETRRLQSLYRRKLTALDELKKSLLHQAFSGNL